MKLNYNYLREQKRLIPLALIGISAIFAFLIFIKTTSFFVASARAETLLRRAVSQTGPDAEALKVSLATPCGECEAKSFAIADELKKSNLFSPQEPEHHPVSSVLGILGEEVLIEDKWYKVGDNIGEARIVSVEASQVRIEWQGRQKVFAPIDGADELTSDGARRIRRDTKTTAQSNNSSNGLAEMVLTGQTRNNRSSTKSSKEQTAVTNKKAEKQRLAAEKKDFQKLSKNNSKATRTARSKVPTEKKTQSDNRKTKEKAAQQKIKKTK